MDRAFIQVYNGNNFNEELSYLEQYGSVAIADNQLHRLEALVNDPKVKNILAFPTAGDPEKAAALVNDTFVAND